MILVNGTTFFLLHIINKVLRIVYVSQTLFIHKTSPRGSEWVYCKGKIVAIHKIDLIWCIEKGYPLLTVKMFLQQRRLALPWTMLPLGACCNLWWAVAPRGSHCQEPFRGIAHTHTVCVCSSALTTSSAKSAPVGPRNLQGHQDTAYRRGLPKGAAVMLYRFPPLFAMVLSCGVLESCVKNYFSITFFTISL